ncbi:septation regulator SpoVG [Ruminococcus sp.]|uniref:septation regulator SpoVG n=1 Tax=Ruminococcus sp. TaxID=41978 RepID=UPI0025DC53A8|nr:septation regulator SpoVG [Ruminococcus sp.]
MTITEIKFRRFMNEGKLRAVVSLTFDHTFAVHDIKVVQGEERLFVAMPSRRDDSGVFRDIVHPINQDLRREIETEILSSYQMELDRQAAEGDLYS